MNTTTKSNVRTVIQCRKCDAPHFTYQLTCKRCGTYLLNEELAAPNTHAMAVAGGILAVSTVVLLVCAVLHAF